jgi:AIPR protein
MLDQIRQEIASDKQYGQNYANDGQRFVAWYLRRVLLLTQNETRQAITDGADDKQIDAVIVDDDNQRVLVIQGKFIGTGLVDAGPLREVLSAWMHLQDLPTLQQDCNERLRERLEAVGRAFDDDYEVEFELLTTGELTPSARADFDAFEDSLTTMGTFAATLHLVDADTIRARLIEAEGKELPELNHTIHIDPTRTVVTEMRGTRSVISAVPLRECLRIPGITDGRLFRKNVRQFLGANNKVNQGLRNTLKGDRVRDFFFYHNGITALCKEFTLSDDRSQLSMKDLSVVNGCQSLATIYSCSERIKTLPEDEAFVLFRFYEIPQRELADRISTFTNSQSAVKPRDLRSNEPTMLGLKKAFEAVYPDGFFITQRGAQRPADRDAEKTVDAADLVKALMAWQCQRPNVAYAEKRLFDEYYKTLIRPGYDPVSILALQTWINAIDRAWLNLQLEDVLKAGKSYTRFHVLFAVSALIAHASKQGDKVPNPSATLDIARAATAEVLSNAVNCVNQALLQGISDAQVNNRVFSPQNWAKNRSSVQAESLVASTIVSMLPSIGGQAALDRLRVAPEHFGLRWSAD